MAETSSQEDATVKYIKRCYLANSQASHPNLRKKLREHLTALRESKTPIDLEKAPLLIIDPVKPATKNAGPTKAAKPTGKATVPQAGESQLKKRPRRESATNTPENRPVLAKKQAVTASSFSSILKSVTSSNATPAKSRKPAPAADTSDDFISLDLDDDSGVTLGWGVERKAKLRKKDIQKLKNPAASASQKPQAPATSLKQTPSNVVVNARKQQTTTAKATVLNERQKRFQSSAPSMYVDEHSLEPIVGTCTKLEKSYLRLTGPPNPAVVRPKRILKTALRQIENKWNESHDYAYCVDQLKSIRQDLSVQGIRDNLTVLVYEFHAQLALESNDLNEFNQCLTQLRELYVLATFQSNLRFELIASHLYYMVHQNAIQNLNEALTHLKDVVEKPDYRITRAFDLLSALFANDLGQVLSIYMQTDTWEKRAIELLVPRVRLQMLLDMALAFKPGINIDVLTSSLRFESAEKTVEFITPFVPHPETISKEGSLSCSEVNLASLRATLEQQSRKR